MDSQKITATSTSDLLVQLRNEDFLKQLESYVLWLAVQDDLDAARRTLKVFELAVNELDGAGQVEVKQHQIYDRLLQLLRAVCLPLLPDEEVELFFKKNLVTVFAMVDIDLLSKLQAKIQRIYMHDERDIFRSKLRNVLLRNAIPFLEVSTGNSLSVGSVLKDYEQAIGGGEVDSFVRERYLAESSLMRSTQQSEREKVRRLFSIYDELKLSSLTAEGVEEKMSFIEDGKYLVLDRGQIREIPNDPGPIMRALLNAKNGFFQAENANVQRVDFRAIDIKSITTVPLSFKTNNPALVFDREDELEVDKHRTKTVAGGELLEQQLRQYANEFIGEQKLTFKDESNRRRFVGVFVSRLKGVRSIVDVRELLQKPAEAGGLGLVGEALERVVNMVEGAVKIWSTKPKDKFDGLIRHEVVSGPVVKNPVMTTPTELPGRAAYTPPPVPTPPPPPPVEPAAVVSTSTQGKNESLTPSGEEEVVAPVSTMPRVTQGAPSFDRAKAEEWRQRMLQELAVKAAAGNVQGSMPNAQTRDGSRGKPTLTDVKAPPKVLGPLEELKSMTIIDLRRLAPTPTEQLVKVQQKIDIIGETSLTRRLEAIKAWQASEVYQLYLKLGRQSMGQGKTIGNLVQQAISLGEPTLTEDEFNSIVDFNAKLRF